MASGFFSSLGKKAYDRFLRDYIREKGNVIKDAIINEVLPRLSELAQTGITDLTVLGRRLISWIRSLDPVSTNNYAVYMLEMFTNRQISARLLIIIVVVVCYY